MPTPTLEPGDALIGGEAIAAFLSELLGEIVSHKKAYQWIEAGRIPAGKWGRLIVVGSKRAIRDHIARCASTLAVPK